MIPSIESHVCRLRNLSWITILLFAVLSLAVTGCGERAKDKAEYGYVTVPSVALRDRVAAIYNKVGLLNNGQRVQIIERSGNKRFVRVRTDDSIEGWLPQRYLVGQEVFDRFQKLAQENSGSTMQSQAVTRRVVNMHVSPARDSETLYQLKEGERLELLKRASTPKGGKALPVQPAEPVDDEKDKVKVVEDEEPAPPATKGKAVVPIAPTPTPSTPMEDWWLTRDSLKRVGWVLGRMVDVEIPLEIAQYAEGQRIVASYVLSEVPENSEADAKKVPQFLVLMSEPKDGLPYDFNQLRVFTWNTKRSRYETAYRERMVGVLPYRAGMEEFGKEGKLPYFAVLVRDVDGKSVERKYKMNGVMVRKVVSGEAVTPPKRKLR